MEPETNKNQKTLHVLKLVIVGVLCFAVLVFVFGVGVFVGQERAGFSFHWAENYHRNFGGPKLGLFGNFPDRDFIGGHGVFGSVIHIDGNSIIVKGQDNMEKTVMVSEQTTITGPSVTMKLSDIKINDNVVIIGSPDEHGVITAKFIRILPQGLLFCRILRG